MRKNLLTLMLGFSFVFFGMLVTKAEASTDKLPNMVKMNKSEFNKIIVNLSATCKKMVGGQCDSAINSANISAAVAWNICVTNVSACQAAQDIAIDILNNAMEICRLESMIEYHQSLIKSRKIFRSKPLS